jgi:hypothetical protein
VTGGRNGAAPFDTILVSTVQKTDDNKVPLRPVSVFQIHENVFYRQESGQLDPLLTVHDVVLSYNNIEANRNEVKRNSLLKTTFILTFLVKDFDRLQDGSLQYANVDNPLYRICLEPADHPGKLQVQK